MWNSRRQHVKEMPGNSFPNTAVKCREAQCWRFSGFEVHKQYNKEKKKTSKIVPCQN